MKQACIGIVALFLLTSCGGEEEVTPVDTMKVRVYWLRDGKVWPTHREVEIAGETPEAKRLLRVRAALWELRDNPTETETAELELSTALPDSLDEAVVVDRVVRYDPTPDLSQEALAQVVYTLTQFADVEAVEVGDNRYTRANFEEQTPAILVESPLPFEEVTSPLRVTGTANTFEANFSYELTDTDGLIIAEDFVTATSGTGTRGTFEFTVPFTVKFDGVGSLIVFEPSAKDGSRTNLVEIPIRMKQ